MAEGHQAVAFSFAVTHDGLDVNFDLEVGLVYYYVNWARSYGLFTCSGDSSHCPQCCTILEKENNKISGIVT